MRGQIAAGTAAVLLAIGLGACGGSSDSGDPVARMGGAGRITKATLDHWTAAIAGNRTAEDPSQAQLTAAREKVLSLLISYQWLTGEAAKRGISMSQHEVRQQIDRILGQAFPGGIAELHEFLKPTGQTVADLELQARAQLALAALRRQATAGLVPVTQEQIATYYAQHKRSYLTPGRREARFTNRKTRAAALKVKREVQAGRSLTSPAQRSRGELFTGASVPPHNEYERAIDSAKPYTVAGPFVIGNDFWLYQVVKVIPARQQTLAEARQSIAGRLTGERRQAALATFFKAWRARWSAQTDCGAGYVVPGCRQYRGGAVEGDAPPDV